MGSNLVELNSSQKQAVEYSDGPLLVVAGPGSGKTRVIIERIQHLVNNGVKPSEILCLTFTKKATGNIIFSCTDSSKIKDALNTSIKTGEGQTVLLKSDGYDEAGDCVSSFEYVWSVRVRVNKK